MKKLLLLTMFIALSLTSCKKEETPDYAAKVVSTYNGSFQDGQNFQSTDYNVYVTKISNDKIKITPEDNHGTSFEVTISESNGTYVGDSNAVKFLTVGVNMTLSYVHNSEEFSGEKQ